MLLLQVDKLREHGHSSDEQLEATTKMYKDLLQDLNRQVCMWGGGGGGGAGRGGYEVVDSSDRKKGGGNQGGRTAWLRQLG